MCSMPLNYTLKNGYDGKFYVTFFTTIKKFLKSQCHVNPRAEDLTVPAKENEDASPTLMMRTGGSSTAQDLF